MRGDWLSDFRRAMEDTTASVSRTEYEPTGLQEDYIRAVGTIEPGKLTLVVTFDPNKVGKTCCAENIIKNIVLGQQSPWFDYPIFREWPFPREGRICGTATNIADSGPIRRELLNWWPPSSFESQKAGKEYHSLYRANSHIWDVMSYNQDVEEYEGRLLGWARLDEPPPARIMGAMTSRFSHGGLMLITATGVGANIGPFLDVLDDLEERGTRVVRISHDIEDNCSEHGKLNSRKSRRGLMTHSEIESYIASLPPDEVDARAHGKVSHKSGKVLKDFSREINVRKVDLADPATGAREWNCFVFVDPHRKYYPAMQFWGLTPENRWVLYNEWPTYDELRSYYHEIRDNLVCPYTPEEMARVVKLYEGQTFGLRAYKRGLDPFFAASTEAEFGRKTLSWVESFTRAGLDFEVPTRTAMDAALPRLQKALKIDRDLPLGPYNQPDVVLGAHCLNSIRAFERHYWLDGKERQAEEYKDFVDCARGVLALTEGLKYRPEWSSGELLARSKKAKDNRFRQDTAVDPYRHMIRETACT